MTHKEALGELRLLVTKKRFKLTPGEAHALNMAIEALEQEPEDVISRQDLDKALYERFHEENSPNNITAVHLGVVRDFIMNFPSITQQPKIGQWISTSEKLPKENKWYQCTVIINDLPQTMELFYKNGKWLDNRRIDMFNTYDIYGYSGTNEKHKLSYQELISEFDWTENVIAWKLLPEPCLNLCKSCNTKGCIFQSGIIRKKCDFYTHKEQEQKRTLDSYHEE